MSLPIIGGLLAGLGKLLGRSLPDRTDVNRAQARLNESEIQGAPPSRLRLWRSFLGWVLALVFAFEVVLRGVLMTYWPEVTLPPSVLEEVSALLLGMLGLGW